MHGGSALPSTDTDRLVQNMRRALSVRYDGYWADCTNTLVLGDPTSDYLRFFPAATNLASASAPNAPFS